MSEPVQKIDPYEKVSHDIFLRVEGFLTNHLIDLIMHLNPLSMHAYEKTIYIELGNNKLNAKFLSILDEYMLLKYENMKI